MFFASHGFILIVVLPLLAAPIAALLPWRKASWGVAMAASLIVLALAIFLNVMTLKASPLSYDLGNWPPPIGIEYLADGLNSFMMLLIGFVAVICLCFCHPTRFAEVTPEKYPLFLSMFLLCLAGLSGITMTNDIFNIYVFLEISSLATYTLIACGRNRQSLMAAYQYLVLGTIGATFFLIGVGMLYMATGTLNISDLGNRLIALKQSTLVDAGLAFLVLGLMLKVALFPLHMWLVQSYSHAPTPVSAFLSATATKVGLYLMVRLLFGVFGANWVFSELPLNLALQGLAAGAVVVGSLAALFQQDVKRLLAFSSVAQIGYIVFGISLGTSLGLMAALLHIFTHGLAKLTLFLGAANVEQMRGDTKLESFKHIGRQMPVTSTCLTIAAFSLVGIPLTAGFLSKWLLLKSALESSHWAFFALMLLSTLAAAAYMWKIIEAVWFTKAKKEKEARIYDDAPILPLAALGVAAICCIYFGLFSDTLLHTLQSAVATYFSAGKL